MLDLFHAMILLLVIEGVCFALFPGLMRRTMLEMVMQPDSSLRGAGIAALVTAIIAGLLLRFAQ